MRPYPSIAVASGKGGTGKTTVAVNLAWTLSQAGQPVQYLDCDAEEPNGAIFLRPIIDWKESVFVEVPQVDLSRCSGCGKCGRLCQYGAIVAAGAHVLTFETLCHSCGGCMQICPEGAIAAKSLEVGGIEGGKAGGMDCVQGLLKIGSVRIPAVIRQVRRRARADAVKILDAPPGTSCPVLAAVRDTDFVLLVTEPTPFGLHDLKLAVAMVRELRLLFGVAINRADSGDKRIEEYCADENIDILLRLPEDRRIAEAYSEGRIIAEVLPEYRKPFACLAERVLL
ncbi:MAG TPA: ATP-binding protein [Anaerohalosphaeraceae bacterium]|nr:ATP-binding protein [Anaerohalosphaeraceae bacterium]